MPGGCAFALLVFALAVGPARAADEREWRAGDFSVASTDGALAISLRGEILVRADYLSGFKLVEPPAVQESEQGDRLEATLSWGADGSTSLTKRIVVRPTDVVVMWVLTTRLEGDEKAGGELGLWVPEAALSVRPAAVFSAYSETEVESGELPMIDPHAIVLGRGDASVEWQLAVDRHRAWMSQDHRESRGDYRFVMVPRFGAPGGTLRAVLHISSPAAHPEAPMRPDGRRLERGPIGKDLCDLIEDDFTLTLVRDRRWAHTSDAVNVVARAYAVDDQARDIDVTYRLVDETGAVCDEGTTAIESDGRRPAGSGISLRPRRNGVYRLEVEYEAEGEVRKRETLFALLPKIDRRRFLPDSVFGAAVSANPYYLKLAETIGLKWNRNHCGATDTRWPRMQTERGTYNWSDETLARLEQHHIKTFGSLFLSPPWYDELRKTDFDKFVDVWVKEYVTPVVGHYKDTIRHWEVWNEPYYEFAGRAADYVKLLRASYEAIKAIDPELQVYGTCGPPGSMSLNWYAEVFAEGGMQYQDGVSGHFYPHGIRGVGGEVQVRQWLQNVKQLIRDFNDGEPAPLWNSESTVSPPATLWTLPYHHTYFRWRPGQGPPNVPDPLEQASFFTKLYLVHFIEDVKYSFHLFTGGEFYTSHPCEYDGTPLTMVVAHAALSDRVEGATYAGEADLHPEIQAHLVERNEEAGACLWGTLFQGDDRADLTILSAPSNLRVLDLFGTELARAASGEALEVRLTSVPVWLVSRRDASADDLRRALVSAELAVKMAPPPQPSQVGTPLEPARDPDWLGFTPIDLSQHANRSFTDETPGDGLGGWTDEGENDLRNLPVGEWVIEGVPFRILDPAENDGKSCLVLFGNQRRDFPESITGIPINERLDELHFLHLCTYGMGREQEVLKYVAHYADGTTVEVPMEGMSQITDWYYGGTLPQAKVAWEGPNLVKEDVRVWYTSWRSPKPAATRLVSLDIVSGRGPVPVVIAITGAFSNRTGHHHSADGGLP